MSKLNNYKKTAVKQTTETDNILQIRHLPEFKSSLSKLLSKWSFNLYNDLVLAFKFLLLRLHKY